MKFYTNTHYSKSHIYIRGYDEGKQFSHRIKYSPTIYLPTADESEWKTIHGRNVSPVRMESIKGMTEYVDSIKQSMEVSGFTEASEQQYAYISELFPDDIQYDQNIIRILIFDIETATEGGFAKPANPFQEINAITAYVNGKFTTWGLGEYQSKKEDREYREFDSELDMLTDFLKFWHEINPDIISGWNIDTFDIPYIINRILLKGDPEILRILSPWKLKPESRIDDRDNQIYYIPGVTSFDYMHLYKKFCLAPRESYSLNNIAAVELGEKKLDYSEYESMQDLYKNNWTKFIDYNIHDVNLVKKLDDKLKFFGLGIKYAYLAKANFEDVFGTVKYWDIAIFNYLKTKKIAVPPRKRNVASEFPGGYVKDPIVGLHNWISTYDLNSLYPSILIQFNISPETIIERPPYPGGVGDTTLGESIINKTFDNLRLTTDDVTMTANGYYFSKNKQGFIPEMLKKIYTMRKQYKGKMLEQDALYEKTHDIKYKILRDQYDSTQHALKIQINALYGALGNAWFRYFDIRMAEATTSTGQVVIKWTEKSVNNYLNTLLKTKGEDYVVGIDTDSVFVSLEGFVNKMYKGNVPEVHKVVDMISKFSDDKLIPMMADGYDELTKYLNCYEPRLVIKNEVIGNKGIFVKRKRYVINVYSSEGVKYEEPKLKVRGLEIVRTSTPEVCRSAIKEAIKVMFDGGEEATQAYIKQFKKKFLTCSPIEIAFPRGISELSKWEGSSNNSSICMKGTPIHVRGAIVHNYFVEKFGIEKMYERIKDGDKVKFLYLSMPNPIKENVISFSNFIPKEFGLDRFIDYETQFEKSFVVPIQTILEAAGWTVEKQDSIEDLFS